MASVEEYNRQLQQRRAQIDEASQMASQIPTRVNQTMTQLQRATPQSQVRVQAAEAQRAKDIQQLKTNISQAQTEQVQLEKEFAPIKAQAEEYARQQGVSEKVVKQLERELSGKRGTILDTPEERAQFARLAKETGLYTSPQLVKRIETLEGIRDEAKAAGFKNVEEYLGVMKQLDIPVDYRPERVNLKTIPAEKIDVTIKDFTSDFVLPQTAQTAQTSKTVNINLPETIGRRGTEERGTIIYKPSIGVDVFTSPTSQAEKPKISAGPGKGFTPEEIKTGEIYGQAFPESKAENIVKKAISIIPPVAIGTYLGREVKNLIEKSPGKPNASDFYRTREDKAAQILTRDTITNVVKEMEIKDKIESKLQEVQMSVNSKVESYANGFPKEVSTQSEADRINKLVKEYSDKTVADANKEFQDYQKSLIAAENARRTSQSKATQEEVFKTTQPFVYSSKQFGEKSVKFIYETIGKVPPFTKLVPVGEYLYKTPTEEFLIKRLESRYGSNVPAFVTRTEARLFGVSKGVYTGLREQPYQIGIRTAEAAAISFALSPAVGIPARLGSYLGVASSAGKGAGIGKALGFGAIGLYGGSVVGRIGMTPGYAKYETAGKILSTEILPIGVGGFIGGKIASTFEKPKIEFATEEPKIFEIKGKSVKGLRERYLTSDVLTISEKERVAAAERFYKATINTKQGPRQYILFESSLVKGGYVKGAEVPAFGRREFLGISTSEKGKTLSRIFGEGIESVSGETKLTTRVLFEEYSQRKGISRILGPKKTQYSVEFVEKIKPAGRTPLKPIITKREPVFIFGGESEKGKIIKFVKGQSKIQGEITTGETKMVSTRLLERGEINKYGDVFVKGKFRKENVLFPAGETPEAVAERFGTKFGLGKPVAESKVIKTTTYGDTLFYKKASPQQITEELYITGVEKGTTFSTAAIVRTAAGRRVAVPIITRPSFSFAPYVSKASEQISRLYSATKNLFVSKKPLIKGVDFEKYTTSQDLGGLKREFSSYYGKGPAQAQEYVQRINPGDLDKFYNIERLVELTPSAPAFGTIAAITKTRLITPTVTVSPVVSVVGLGIKTKVSTRPISLLKPAKLSVQSQELALTGVSVSSQAQERLQAQIQPQIQIQPQPQIQIQPQPQIQIQPQPQVQIQPQIQIQARVIGVPTTPPRTVFIPGIVFPGTPPEKFKRKKKIATKTAYITEIRRRGKFFKIGSPTSKTRALLAGAKEAKKTLAATFRVRKVNLDKAISLPSEIPYVPSPVVFRAPRGKRELPMTFVQRAPQRLKASTEVKEIISSRKKRVFFK